MAEWTKALDSKSSVRESVPWVRIPPFPFVLNSGEMAERLKAHAWKACLAKTNVGSNPTLSAYVELYDARL